MADDQVFPWSPQVRPGTVLNKYCQINKKTVSWYLKARQVTHDLKWIYFLGGLVSKPKGGTDIF